MRGRNRQPQSVVRRAHASGNPDVLLQWRKPAHEEFAARSAFSLWNAFTEVFKSVNPHTALRRGEALHGLFDAETGVALAA